MDVLKIDEITTLMVRYADGFARDPSSTADFYALPMIYIGPETVSVICTRAGAVAFVKRIVARLRPNGFTHTTVENCAVNLTRSSIALCTIDGTRRRADGTAIERIRGVYVLTAHPHWRIRGLIAADPDEMSPQLDT